MEAVDAKRRAAVKRAAEGEFSLAFTLFREAFQMAPVMPSSWQQHPEALQEVRRAIDYNLSVSVMQEAQSLHTFLHVLFDAAAEGKPYRVTLDTVLEEHVRDIEKNINNGARIAQMQMSVEMMCSSTEITVPRLRQLESLFLHVTTE